MIMRDLKICIIRQLVKPNFLVRKTEHKENLQRKVHFQNKVKL